MYNIYIHGRHLYNIYIYFHQESGGIYLKHNLPVTENLLNQNFKADKPNAVRVYVNPAFSKSCGLTPDRQIGKFVRELESNAKILKVKD